MAIEYNDDGTINGYIGSSELVAVWSEDPPDDWPSTVDYYLGLSQMPELDNETFSARIGAQTDGNTDNETEGKIRVLVAGWEGLLYIRWYVSEEATLRYPHKKTLMAPIGSPGTGYSCVLNTDDGGTIQEHSLNDPSTFDDMNVFNVEYGWTKFAVEEDYGTNGAFFLDPNLKDWPWGHHIQKDGYWVDKEHYPAPNANESLGFQMYFRDKDATDTYGNYSTEIEPMLGNDLDGPVAFVSWDLRSLHDNALKAVAPGDGTDPTANTIDTKYQLSPWRMPLESSGNPERAVSGRTKLRTLWLELPDTESIIAESTAGSRPPVTRIVYPDKDGFARVGLYGNGRDTKITIRNNGKDPFRLTSYAIEGTYVTHHGKNI